MPHLVAGAWRTRGALHVADSVVNETSLVRENGAPLPVGDGIDDAVPDLAARVAALHLEEQQDEGAENEDPADGAGGSQFDWPAYHAVWGQTPIDEAITAMFAEFAVLHAEMSGYTCSTSPLPLTLDVGKSIADRAERFVTLYMTPILGPQHSTKVHRLLCHVMGAIRMHGNINNGNAGLNEQLHKEDKPYYARTSKTIADFTRQLVVQAQGARIVLHRNAAEDEDPASLLVGCDGEEGGESDGTDFDDDDDIPERGDGVSRGGRAAGATDEDAAASSRGGDASAAARASPYHLRLTPLSVIAQRPGLEGIGAALGLPEDARVRISSRPHFMAVFECGWTVKQLLYASPSFRGAPWYDSVLYSTAEVPATLSVAEVRAILRRPEGDVALIADMVAVPGVANYPLVSRGCMRLAWRVLAGDTDVRLRVLPVACIRRVVHVVPDFADLVRRVDVHAEPAGMDAPLADCLAMRYFINAFYPWSSSA